jgi:molybdate transport system substrate-binding protein
MISFHPVVRATVVAIAAALAGCGTDAGPAGSAATPAAPAPARREVAVAAAADLRFALDEVIVAFARASPEIAVKPVYGSSGSLFAQIQNKAPFDVFLSADVSYPRKLVEAGLALEGEREFVYAVGHLVLWAPSGSAVPVEKGVQALLDPAVRKVAIANPAHAPYGRAAEAALKGLGVYDAVAPRLVLGENISQTFQFIESGAADVGVVALSLALAPNVRGKGKYWQLPDDSYPPLEQGGLVLRTARDAEAALAFRRYFTTDAAPILKRYGFALPGS